MKMVLWAKSIENVLRRIHLEGVARNGECPDIYWQAKKELAGLDKSCLNVYAQTDERAPLGWRRNNSLILKVGYLKFSYTKHKLENGEILITVDEVADSNGNILTENIQHNYTMDRLRKIIYETVKTTMKEIIR